MAIDQSFVGPAGGAKEAPKTDPNELLRLCANDADFHRDVNFSSVRHIHFSPALMKWVPAQNQPYNFTAMNPALKKF